MCGSAWSRLLHDTTFPDPMRSLVRHMQEQAFPEGLDFLYQRNITNLSYPNKKLATMTTFKDKEGIVRCGGGLPRVYLTFGRQNTIGIPEGREGDALIGYIHANKAAHQGRIVTYALIIDEGFLLLGGHRRVDILLRKCTECKMLRAKPMVQKMADYLSKHLKRCLHYNTPAWMFSGLLM